MAHFKMYGVDNLCSQLEELGLREDEAILYMIDEAANIMDEELKKEIRASTKKYGTGVLADSIHHNPPRRNRFGAFTVSTARGKDTKKGKYGKTSHAAYNKRTGEYVGHRESYGVGAVRNHDKLYFKEYGNSRQASHPFIEKCVRRAEPAVLDKMQEIFDQEVAKL